MNNTIGQGNNTDQLEKVLLYLRPEDFDFYVNRKLFVC